jgi:hypothetical protein
VRASVALSGYTVESFTAPLQGAFARATAASLALPSDHVAVTSVSAAPPAAAARRALLDAAPAVHVGYSVRATSAATAGALAARIGGGGAGGAATLEELQASGLSALTGAVLLSLPVVTQAQPPPIPPLPPLGAAAAAPARGPAAVGAALEANSTLSIALGAAAGGALLAGGAALGLWRSRKAERARRRSKALRSASARMRAHEMRIAPLSSAFSSLAETPTSWGAATPRQPGWRSNSYMAQNPMFWMDASRPGSALGEPRAQAPASAVEDEPRAQTPLPPEPRLRSYSVAQNPAVRMEPSRPARAADEPGEQSPPCQEPQQSIHSATLAAPTPHVGPTRGQNLYSVAMRQLSDARRALEDA